ncbi:sugar ABC transporter permease [Plantibacter sp. PA-3-X8]|uniref:Carbohydrate ABC transporter membrane protein 1, CUT1 family n=2 Tax=Plantibacter TaxID=190323 RepID=A0ABY1LP77_9MICO|nr:MULTISPECIES: sugar ABC transporter permease [Plantibacter]AZH83738.1 sugar ABC transporter permease [Plantibacter sp. PA-3-X8]SKC57339.1 carbohydrate ABC transporter membrane protein 1, CUT1 family [Plantibacter cousiniae]SMQ66918.1 carbohydrate ABC transporter membrane protein 1, CUT1 family [Plantibacter sp. VKM Ac-1784]
MTGTIAPRRARGRTAARRAVLIGWLFTIPALLAYIGFVVYPLLTGVQYSFYRWNGVGPSEWVGFANYLRVFTDPDLLGSIGNAFILIVFFTAIPVSAGLVLANLMRSMRPGPFSTVSQTILFLPQIIPLAAAGIAWSWMYAQTGAVNQILGAVGLGGLARPWLGDFQTALPAVGLIGSWVLTGLCTVLFLTGIGKIDSSLYEAIRLDGAGWLREFTTITVPGLRQEISVLVTITVIAALSSFDIIYTTTLGGPGRSTLVPGISIYRIGFTQSDVGLASAFGIVLMVLVLACVLPLQRLAKVSDR